MKRREFIIGLSSAACVALVPLPTLVVEAPNMTATEVLSRQTYFQDMDFICQFEQQGLMQDLAVYGRAVFKTPDVKLFSGE